MNDLVTSCHDIVNEREGDNQALTLFYIMQFSTNLTKCHVCHDKMSGISLYIKNPYNYNAIVSLG